MLAFAIGAAAMIIVLSALNGFEKTLTSLFTSFDPEIKIESVKGKTFVLDSIKYKQILEAEGIDKVAIVVEDNAVLKYGESQEIAVIKGVSDNYNQVTQIDCTLVEGQFLLGNDDIAGAVFGYELASKLGLNLENSLTFVTVYVPRKGELNNLNPAENLIMERILPTGKFFVQEEIDGHYVLVPLAFARKLFAYTNEISALEISLKSNSNLNSIRSKLRLLLGSGFTIKDQYEQKESIYKIFKSEKLATFAILSFILLIAAFNMAGSLTMLIIEKEKDINILKSIGMSKNKIQMVFLSSGLVISLIGCIIGLVLGGSICWLQLKFGLLGIENSIVEAYPVAIKPLDFLMVIIMSLFIGWLTAWIPTRKIGMV